MRSAAHAPASRVPATVPPRAGVGLKPAHYQDILETTPDLGWFEVHPENYMGAGGAPHYYLEKVRALYPLSLHGVGLSIGAAGRLSREHLGRLKALVARYEPGLFSEHLAWSTHEGTYFNDLLPLPYTEQTLRLVADHVDETQEAIGRRILIENPSTYLTFPSSDLSEIAFLTELVRRTGCGLLLDINNVLVSTANNGGDAAAYIDAFPAEHVAEIHLAGSAAIELEQGERLFIDTHDRPVADKTWSLYRRFLSRSGPRPTLIEWDNDIPPWTALSREAERADRILAELSVNEHS